MCSISTSVCSIQYIIDTTINAIQVKILLKFCSKKFKIELATQLIETFFLLFSSQYWEVYQLTANSEPNMLYIGAARDFGRARQLFESVSSIGTPLQDYEVLVSITKKNLVASSVLAKDSSRKIDFDFESHKTFPVIKLVS